MKIGSVLKGHDIFKSLTVDEVNQISGFSSEKKFRKDEVIYSYRQAVTHVFFNLKGTVELRLTANKPELSFIISKVEQGELFGVSSLLGSERYTATAVAVEDASVLVLEAKPFRELLRKNSTAGFHIINQVAVVYLERYMNVMKSLQAIINQIPLVR